MIRFVATANGLALALLLASFLFAPMAALADDDICCDARQGDCAFPDDLAGPRLAAVFGTDDYALPEDLADGLEIGDLDNAGNDAKDVAATLDDAGYSVGCLLHPTRLQFQRAILSLRKAISAAAAETTTISDDKVAFVFNAGHGAVVNGRDTLFFRPSPELVVARDVEAIRRDQQYLVGTLYLELAGFDTYTIATILDVCRSNITIAGAEGHFRAIGPVPPRVVASYSTTDGRAALDRMDGDSFAETNGLFTSRLLRFLKLKGAHLDDVLVATNQRVIAVSDQRQQPDFDWKGAHRRVVRAADDFLYETLLAAVLKMVEFCERFDSGCLERATRDELEKFCSNYGENAVLTRVVEDLRFWLGDPLVGCAPEKTFVSSLELAEQFHFPHIATSDRQTAGFSASGDDAAARTGSIMELPSTTDNALADADGVRAAPRVLAGDAFAEQFIDLATSGAALPVRYEPGGIEPVEDDVTKLLEAVEANVAIGNEVTVEIVSEFSGERFGDDWALAMGRAARIISAMDRRGQRPASVTTHAVPSAEGRMPAVRALVLPQALMVLDPLLMESQRGDRF